MKRSEKKRDRSLGDEVLCYLYQHPEAQDTIEGIAQWWLLEQRIRQSIEEVTSVLAEFEAQELVVTRRGVDGRIRYRMNPKKKQQIHSRLKGKCPGQAAAAINAEVPRSGQDRLE